MGCRNVILIASPCFHSFLFCIAFPRGIRDVNRILITRLSEDIKKEKRNSDFMIVDFIIYRKSIQADLIICFVHCVYEERIGLATE